ncbi:phosphatase PAP2 family protein [Thalassospira profundimaris]|uniref:phosphatase PAP2 family protein n=1 Tax=Thalassospira profundimaris TaxID=502049 RepID=UPI0015F0B066|nr:phosphatase PAP2 family protein [Thalassospira profundimaris]
MIFLDEPSHYWRETLPVGFLHTFGWLNALGNSSWLLLGSGVLCLVLLAQNTRKFGLRLRMALYSTFIYSAFLFYTVAVSGLLVIAIKWPLGRARPKLFDTMGAFHFDPLIFKAAYSSFPSGHATTVGATIVTLALIFPSWRGFIFATGFWVAISRVIWGAHYPSDAFTGVLLGATFSYYSARVLARRHIGFKLSAGGRLHRSLGVSSARQCRHVVGNMLKKPKNGQAPASSSVRDAVVQSTTPLRSRN